VIGKDAKAEEVYTELLTKRQRELAPRVRLMLLQVKQGKDVAFHLSKFNPKDWKEVGQQIRKRLANYKTEKEFKIALELVRATIDLVHADCGSAADQSWAIDLVDTLQGLFNAPLPTRPTSEYCYRKLVDVRGTGPAAFTALFRSRRNAVDLIDDEYFDLAIRAIRNSAPQTDGSNAAHQALHLKNMSLMSKYLNHDKMQTIPVSPAEFLASYVGKKEPAIRDERLAEIRRKLVITAPCDELEELDRLLGLYAANGRDFEEVAFRILKTATQSTGKINGLSRMELARIIDIWSETESNADLSLLVLDPAWIREKYGSIGDLFPILQYLHHLIEREKYDEVRELFLIFNEQAYSGAKKPKSVAKCFYPPPKLPTI